MEEDKASDGKGTIDRDGNGKLGGQRDTASHQKGELEKQHQIEKKWTDVASD